MEPTCSFRGSLQFWPARRRNAHKVKTNVTIDQYISIWQCFIFTHWSQGERRWKRLAIIFWVHFVNGFFTTILQRICIWITLVHEITLWICVWTQVLFLTWNYFTFFEIILTATPACLWKFRQFVRWNCPRGLQEVGERNSEVLGGMPWMTVQAFCLQTISVPFSIRIYCHKEFHAINIKRVMFLMAVPYWLSLPNPTHSATRLQRGYAAIQKRELDAETSVYVLLACAIPKSFMFIRSTLSQNKSIQ